VAGGEVQSTISIAAASQMCAFPHSVLSSTRDKLHKIKNLKEQLKRAKLDLQRAERNGDLARAGELAYGIVPTLEKQLPKEYVLSFLYACMVHRASIQG
jgi:hypothetical protein